MAGPCTSRLKRHDRGVLARPLTGTLTPLPGSTGCVSGARREPCTLVRGLDFLSSLAVSHDGRSAYAWADGRAALIAIRRRPYGSLVQLPDRAGCLRRTRTRSCAPAPGLQSWPFMPTQVAISRDDRFVYVLGRAIAAFRRVARRW
jgi:prepilin-type processing-associated H-X9-DG protein